MSKHLARADNSVFQGEKILAAISSGGDSVALFWWLKSQNAEFAVGHVHHDLHELRGDECARDAEFVRALCERGGVEFHLEKLDLPRKNGPHVNEATAREARYLALERMARRCGAKSVATAHSATDLLETAILNLLRGGGFGGWNGFAPLRSLGGDLGLARPFWRVTREELREFLREIGENWREDASNFAPDFLRNRVRHEVLPLLENIGGHDLPSLARGFARNAQIARDEDDFAAREAAKALETLVLERENHKVVLDGTKFRELHPAISRRVLRLCLALLKISEREIGFEKVEEVRLHVLGGGKRKVWNWRRDLFVEWTGAACGNRLRVWRV